MWLMSSLCWWDVEELKKIKAMKEKDPLGKKQNKRWVPQKYIRHSWPSLTARQARNPLIKRIFCDQGIPAFAGNGVTDF